MLSYFLQKNILTASGSRIFDVYFEQNRVIENLDIYQSVGKDAALVREITNVEINDGVLDIQFAEKIDNALLCGIVITPVSTGLLDDENINELKSFKVEQNYPNPFNGKTIINYSLTASDNLSFQLYNVLGEQIFFKDLGFTQSGSYQFQLDTASIISNPLTSGIYFYVFTGSNVREIRKFVLLN